MVSGLDYRSALVLIFYRRHTRYFLTFMILLFASDD